MLNIKKSSLNNTLNKKDLFYILIANIIIIIINILER